MAFTRRHSPQNAQAAVVFVGCGNTRGALFRVKLQGSKIIIMPPAEENKKVEALPANATTTNFFFFFLFVAKRPLSLFYSNAHGAIGSSIHEDRVGLRDNPVVLAQSGSDVFGQVKHEEVAVAVVKVVVVTCHVGDPLVDVGAALPLLYRVVL